MLSQVAETSNLYLWHDFTIVETSNLYLWHDFTIVYIVVGSNIAW